MKESSLIWSKLYATRDHFYGDAQFVVSNNHCSLKFLLDQRLSTIPQHEWVSELFVYDLKVEFRPGRQNQVADALPRCDEGSATLGALSSPHIALFDDIRMQAQSNMDASGWSGHA
jgi:hypothetical protein